MNTASTSGTGKTAQQRQHCSGHRQRLRERFLRDPRAMPDYELLELLLSYCQRQGDTKPLAKALLAKFGTLGAVMEAPPEALLEVPFLGPEKGTFWHVQREMRARMAEEQARTRDLLSSPEAVAHMARARLAGCRHEECWLALVDAQNGLMEWLPVQQGDVHEVSVSPGAILRTALARKASGIILVHNHPGGRARPSGADSALTEQLRDLAPRLGVRFLDHVIVSDGESFSMVMNTTV